ncbi:MAG: hypothetical protein WC455_11300 [Dehalococcoidia bacterium]
MRLLTPTQACPFSPVLGRLTTAGIDRLQRCRDAKCGMMLPVEESIRCTGVGGGKCTWVGKWAERLNDAEWTCPHWNPRVSMKDHAMRRPSHREQMTKLPPIITQAKAAKSRGLGDVLEAALSKVGITHDRVDAWLGRPCGCAERKERLNRLFSWARSIGETPPEEAAAKVEEIFKS